MPKTKLNNPPEAEAESVPSSLRIVCDDAATITLAAAETSTEGEDKPSLRKFSMVAYTGGAMRLGGWPYPVVVDLAGSVLEVRSMKGESVDVGDRARVGWVDVTPYPVFVRVR